MAKNTSLGYEDKKEWVGTVVNQTRTSSEGDTPIAGTANVELILTKHSIFWKMPELWVWM